MNQQNLEKLRLELSVQAKNGVDFILSASIIWFGIAWLWTLSFSSYDKSVLTFIVGGLMLPVAFGMSKILKTNWKIKDNPLQPLGLWLNFAQLFYFPFLVFILLKHPDYFIMTYAIITGAHFFPYGWFYNEKAYVVAAGVLSVGALFTALFVRLENMFYLPLFVALSLIILAGFLLLSYKRKLNRQE